MSGRHERNILSGAHHFQRFGPGLGRLGALQRQSNDQEARGRGSGGPGGRRTRPLTLFLERTARHPEGQHHFDQWRGKPDADKAFMHSRPPDAEDIALDDRSAVKRRVFESPAETDLAVLDGPCCPPDAEDGR